MTRLFLLSILMLFCLPALAWAQGGLPTITVGIDEATNPQQVSTALQVLFVLTVLSIAPAILLMTTSLSLFFPLCDNPWAPSRCPRTR